MASAVRTFRSTPLREGRRVSPNETRLEDLFRSTPLREGRPAVRSSQLSACLFRSTPLREGRRGSAFPPPPHGCFDPRPCARGDCAARARIDGRSVSIHAPARGATRWGEVVARVMRRVSIHAPARGATRLPDRTHLQFSGFDPRPCARGDSNSVYACCIATSFDPRPCARGDQGVPRPASNCFRFRSTPLREGRRPSRAGRRRGSRFRSTPLREGRPAWSRTHRP